MKTNAKLMSSSYLSGFAVFAMISGMGLATVLASASPARAEEECLDNPVGDALLAQGVAIGSKSSGFGAAPMVGGAHGTCTTTKDSPVLVDGTTKPPTYKCKASCTDGTTQTSDNFQASLACAKKSCTQFTSGLNK